MDGCTLCMPFHIHSHFAFQVLTCVNPFGMCRYVQVGCASVAFICIWKKAYVELCALSYACTEVL